MINNGAPGGVTLPDFVENSLGVSLDEIIVLAKEDPHYLIAKRDSFYGLMENSWAATTADELPSVPAHDLRPIYGKGLITQRGKLSSYYSDSADHSRTGREVKALLLYAHSTIVMNPLAPWFEVVAGSLRNSEPPNGMGFIGALIAVSEIGDLIRDGTVAVIDPPAISWNENLKIDDAISKAATRRYHRHNKGRQLDQWDQYAATQDALIRMMVYSSVDPNDRQGGFCANSTLEGNGYATIIRALAETINPDLPLPSDEARLEALMHLSLPGVDDLHPKDMILVRSDSKFAAFRADVRVALSAVDAALDQGDLRSARRDVAEFMAARAEELKASPARTRFWNATSGDALSFAIGGALTALAGWKAALLGLLAKGLYETVRDTSAPLAALRQHYVAMSRTDETPTSETTGADLIRSWRKGSR